MRDEILRARQIGLNGLREHIKIESPRKLYWADRLGVLIMADVPNWWGPPDSAAFREHEVAMRGMIDRDYNHPAVFSWVTFNETWGLTTKVGDKERYLPETQQQGRERLPAREVARPHAARRGQLRRAAAEGTRRPTSTRGTTTCPVGGGRHTSTASATAPSAGSAVELRDADGDRRGSR